MELYNILALIWSLLTIWSGLRYTSGKTGPLTWWGGFFDYVFGLDACKSVPAENQRASSFREPCWQCEPGGGKGLPYPHGGQPQFRTMPKETTIEECTAVNGVGGVTGTNVTGRLGSKAVSTAQYIVGFFTGNVNGSVSQAEYDKKRFKNGTPYAALQSTTNDSIGYYYTQDSAGNEIPLLAPCNSGTYSFPSGSLNAFLGSSTGPFPVGWNAYLNTENSAWGQQFGRSTIACDAGGSYVQSGQTPWNPKSAQLIYNDPNQTAPSKWWSDKSGFQNITPTSAPNGYNQLYASTVLANVNKIEYKQFNSNAPTSMPNQWQRKL